MTGIDESLIEADIPDEYVEKCSGCGITSHRHNPFRWKIDHGLPDFAPDVYCDQCFWEFRKTAFSEEALLMTLKLSGLPELFSMDELQRAMEAIAGLTKKAFAEAFRSGPPCMPQPRPAEEIARVYGAEHGGAQAA